LSSSAVIKEEIIKNSRKKYGRPKYLVEEEIKQFTAGETPINIEINLKEIQPVRKKEVYAPELAVLGIEFPLKEEKQKESLENEESTEEISLSQLVPRDLKPKEFPKEKIDLEELKKSIYKSLEENIKEE
jgi:hypothetical protein